MSDADDRLMANAIATGWCPADYEVDGRPVSDGRADVRVEPSDDPRWVVLVVCYIADFGPVETTLIRMPVEVAMGLVASLTMRAGGEP